MKQPRYKGRFLGKPKLGGVTLMAIIIFAGWYLKITHDPQEWHTPLVGEIKLMAVAKAQEPAPQVIVEPPKLSKRTNGCIKNRPEIAQAIKNKFKNNPDALDLICRESSFNPEAINPISGACGLAQALPCSKMKCELSDVKCQLDWIGDYVIRRYGSFENAISFHNINQWY